MNEHLEKKETNILNTNLGDCVKIAAKSSWVKPVSLFFLLLIVFGLGMSMGEGRGYRGDDFERGGRFQQSGCTMFQKGRNSSDYMMGRSQGSYNFSGYERMNEVRNRMMNQSDVNGTDASLEIQ